MKKCDIVWIGCPIKENGRRGKVIRIVNFDDGDAIVFYEWESGAWGGCTLPAFLKRFSPLPRRRGRFTLIYQQHRKSKI